mmetsp:Transcript_12266/g.36637  ORF Transcript_12266/g.36637 Transcript_12266/m.36637 type:complete len:249 (+) Transcript_12266:2374-3120(+)
MITRSPCQDSLRCVAVTSSLRIRLPGAAGGAGAQDIGTAPALDSAFRGMTQQRSTALSDRLTPWWVASHSLAPCRPLSLLQQTPPGLPPHLVETFRQSLREIGRKYGAPGAADDESAGAACVLGAADASRHSQVLAPTSSSEFPTIPAEAPECAPPVQVEHTSAPAGGGDDALAVGAPAASTAPASEGTQFDSAPAVDGSASPAATAGETTGGSAPAAASASPGEAATAAAPSDCPAASAASDMEALD